MKITLTLPVPGPNHSLSNNISVTKQDNIIYVISEISPQQTNEPIQPGYIEFEIDVNIEHEAQLQIKHAIVFTEKPRTHKFVQNKMTLTSYIRNKDSAFLVDNLILSDDAPVLTLIKTHDELTFTLTKSPTFSYQALNNSNSNDNDTIDNLITNTTSKAQPKAPETNAAAQGSTLATVIGGALTFGLFAVGAILRLAGTPEEDPHQKLDL